MAKQIIAACIIALLTSCSTAKMAVDNSQWNNTQELSVKGRQGLLIKQKLSFGEYKTISVKRSWTKVVLPAGHGAVLVMTTMPESLALSFQKGNNPFALNLPMQQVMKAVCSVLPMPGMKILYWVKTLIAFLILPLIFLE